jgi:hypothetical protein
MKHEQDEELLTDERPAYTPPCATRMKDLPTGARAGYIQGCQFDGQTATIGYCGDQGSTPAT